MLTAIILLLHGLYACILYLFNPKERALFLVGLMTLSVAVIILARNDNLLLAIVPINYTWSLKIRLLAFLWQNLFILLVFRKFTSVAKINKWLRAYVVSLGLYSVFILTVPAYWVSTSIHLGIIQVFQYIPFIWLLYSLGRLLFKSKMIKMLFFCCYQVRRSFLICYGICGIVTDTIQLSIILWILSQPSWASQLIGLKSIFKMLKRTWN